MTGPQIKTLRKRLGKTQVEFAHLLQTHAPAVSNWERGKHAPGRFYQAALKSLAKNGASK